MHRDKFGQRIDLKLEKLKKKEEERKKEEREVQNLKWGRGCVLAMASSLTHSYTVLVCPTS